MRKYAEGVTERDQGVRGEVRDEDNYRDTSAS